jgi:pimeloyl-ACP methyl ester carboxylesterase
MLSVESQPMVSVIETARGPFWVGQQGAGHDVVLISGLGDTHEIWEDVTPLLTDAFRVTFFDNRGAGRTTLGSHELSVEGFAEDTLAVMRAAGVDRAHIVGSSMGGAIAQEVALAESGHVMSLTLAGTWARPDEYLNRLLRHMARLQVLIEDPRELMETICLWVYSSRAHADGTVDRLIKAMDASTSPAQPQAVFARTVEAATRHDAADRLDSITSPTLVLVGGEDRVCPLRLSQELSRLIAGSHLRVLDGCGHQPFQEEPGGFADAVREFWNRI